MIPYSAGLDAINAAVWNERDEDKQLVAAKCRGLLWGYHKRWLDDTYTALGVEQVLESPLVNPDTGRSSRTFTLAGKLDVIAERDGKRILIDHKTTSEDIGDPNAAYWRQLAIEGQVNQYMILDAMTNGSRFDHAVWDVVKKPGIRPKKLSKADRAAIVETGMYCGFEVSTVDRNYVQQVENENPGLYTLRLAADCTERGEWYFQRVVVPRLDSELLEYARELWGHSQEILAARQSERYPRNSGACMMYGSACEYLGICSGHDTPDSDRWQKVESVHAELDGVGGSALTNSRVRCFQTCRRKHLYRYEIGIRRQHEEDREALYFGTLWHTALEAYWKCFLVKDQSHDDTDTDDAGSGATDQAELAGGDSNESRRAA